MENQSWFRKNKFWTALIIISSILFILRVILYGKGVQFFVTLPLLFTTFPLIVKYRKQLADIFRKIPAPKFLVYLLSSVPFLLFEENINCLPTGCKVIPTTMPILLIFVSLLGIFAWLLKAKSIFNPIAVFCLFGTLLELSPYGAASTALWVLPAPIALFFVVEIAVSYIYVVVVPLTILLE